MKRTLSFSLAALVLSGCQGALPGISGLGQPGRVPPPGTGSYQVPGTYSGGAGPASTMVPKSGSPTAPTVGAVSTSPLIDQVASAQNQLKQATDSARAAVMQSTQNIQSQVEQAGARADKIGAGVVQASQILNDAALGTLPTTTAASSGTLGTTSGAPRVAIPSPPSTSGTLSDSDAAIATDPNAQWRKPTPR